MADCECLPTCIFFNEKMANMPSMTSIFKKTYCEGGDYEKCARHMVFKALGKSSVPQDLYPNQIERAAELIGKH